MLLVGLCVCVCAGFTFKDCVLVDFSFSLLLCLCFFLLGVHCSDLRPIEIRKTINSKAKENNENKKIIIPKFPPAHAHSECMRMNVFGRIDFNNSDSLH